MSLLHASFHCRSGRPFLLSLVCPHLTFFSVCAHFSFSLHGGITSDGFCNFLGHLHHSCFPSNVFISDLIPPCHSAQFCKPSHSASLVSSCHTTIHCISSSFPMLHSLSVKIMWSCLMSPPRLNVNTSIMGRHRYGLKAEPWYSPTSTPKLLLSLYLPGTFP